MEEIFLTIYEEPPKNFRGHAVYYITEYQRFKKTFASVLRAGFAFDLFWRLYKIYEINTGDVPKCAKNVPKLLAALKPYRL